MIDRMKKFKKIFEVASCEALTPDSVLLKATPVDGEMPEILGGQFVNILVPQAPGAFLRRPISVCNVEYGELWLFVKNVGKGSAWLCSLRSGAELDMVLPLGHGFTMPKKKGASVLLVGGGVGVAPLLYWGRILKQNGYSPEFLLGAATACQLTLIDEFESVGKVHLTTDDGSKGVKGFVVRHPVIASEDRMPDMIYCCGPTPMMKSVARIARERHIDCEVSLENHMACGIGACLCCVEKTVAGNVCVCTYGPVFNVKELTW